MASLRKYQRCQREIFRPARPTRWSRRGGRPAPARSQWARRLGGLGGLRTVTAGFRKGPAAQRTVADHLSHYLEGVQAGQEVIVTDRGRAVARVVALSGERTIDRLIAEGVVTPGEAAHSEAAASAEDRWSGVGPGGRTASVIAYFDTSALVPGIAASRLGLPEGTSPVVNVRFVTSVDKAAVLVPTFLCIPALRSAALREPFASGPQGRAARATPRCP